jgi:hypothetical protein
MLRDGSELGSSGVWMLQHTLEAVGEDIGRAAVSRNRGGQGAVVVVVSTGGTSTSDTTSCEASATAAAADTGFATDTGLLLESATTRQGAVSVCSSRGVGHGAVDTSVLESDWGWVANSASNYNGVSTFYSSQDRR